VPRANSVSIADFSLSARPAIVAAGGNRENMGNFMRVPTAAIAFALALASIAVASADNYPSRPVTMVVPFAAGGPTDTIARIVSDHMKDTLGQPVVIETVTGAGSTIGVGRVAGAQPDGYMIYVGNWSSSVGAPALYPVSWNPVNDFEPVARLPVSSLMIVGKTGVPANTAQELIAWLKANPDKATAVSVGAGSGAHICGLYFQDKTGTKFQFAQYRGGAPAMQDLIGNQIDIMCAEASQTLAHVRGGKMKAFAVMGSKRWPPLPDVPTMEEVGVTGMTIEFWHGMWAPKGTPKDVVAKLNTAVVKALDDPAVQKRVEALGMSIPTKAELTPQSLHTYHKAELDKWWPIIKAAGIKVN
jgi:tripartite-type tricarboxylate transporter receptor subunit TctC